MSDTVSLALRIAELEQSVALRDTEIEALSARLFAVQPLESAITSLLTAAHKQAIDKAVAEYTAQAVATALSDVDMSDLVAEAVIHEITECLPSIVETHVEAALSDAIDNADIERLLIEAVEEKLGDMTIRF